ncbi:hypothetical protein BS50DRAFT_583184 [Corynespora cassiicola Philippines]|uniref:Tail assembly chaperone n=1 Tax=Corynespora cassiicola Philippines TaxID=1448308 RepID=A0A2T2P7Q2_CORCC|nr:hypothetical protein BS50DRAFT_583184 [Corynespora cassiicola Philippines]
MLFASSSTSLFVPGTVVAAAITSATTTAATDIAMDPPRPLTAREKNRLMAEKEIKACGNDDQALLFLSPEAADTRFHTLDATPRHLVAGQYTAEDSLAIMRENWGGDLLAFLPRHDPPFLEIRPPPTIVPASTFAPDIDDMSTWDLVFLATLAVVADIRPGQGAQVARELDAAARWRIASKAPPRAIDITDVFKGFKTVEELKREKAREKNVKRGKARRGKAKAKKKAEKEIKDVDEEDTFPPAKPSEVDALAEKMGLSSLPEVMPEEGSDDD